MCMLIRWHDLWRLKDDTRHNFFLLTKISGCKTFLIIFDGQFSHINLETHLNMIANVFHEGLPAQTAYIKP